MKNLFLTITALFLSLTTVIAQFADPAVTGANFVPNQIQAGQNSVLTVSFANTGSTVIPVSSIEITISTAYNYYKTNGTTSPNGPGAGFFNWTHISTAGADIWKGTNNMVINAFEGGNIVLTVTGNTVSTGFETTSINVQPVSNLAEFNDSPTNNFLQPQLKINQACPLSPTLSGSTNVNVCPLTTANLTTLQPLPGGGQTFEWHTVASTPIGSTIVSSPMQVQAGTYYLYVKDIFSCYSPASQPVLVTISICTSPDITISLGQPTPTPIAFKTSFIPVTVANIGTAPTTGQITAVVQIPFGTSFGTFPEPVSNGGWTCSTSGTTATCTSSTPIASSSNITFNVPFIPTAAQAGNPLTIPAAVVSGGGEPAVNTGNNTSNIITTNNVTGADLTPNFTFSSSTFTLGESRSIIININEIGNIPTNGTPIAVFIPNSTGFTYTFDPSATSVDAEAVNNQNWTTSTTTTIGILLTSTTVIPANGRSRIAITRKAITAGAEASITVNITPYGGGDTKFINNITSLSQSIQR